MRSVGGIAVALSLETTKATQRTTRHDAAWMCVSPHIQGHQLYHKAIAAGNLNDSIRELASDFKIGKEKPHPATFPYVWPTAESSQPHLDAEPRPGDIGRSVRRESAQTLLSGG